jgi:hypothetical protein
MSMMTRSVERVLDFGPTVLVPDIAIGQCPRRRDGSPVLAFAKGRGGSQKFGPRRLGLTPGEARRADKRGRQAEREKNWLHP